MLMFVTTLLLCGVVCLATTASKLQCNENNSFRIVQFTDTHFGESNIGNYLTASLMSSILDTEKPDLVVLSGDIISGYTWNGQPHWFHNLWHKAVQPMVQRNIPWLFTPGNHDAEGELNRTQIFEYETSRYAELGSLSQLGFIDGKTGQNIYSISIHKQKSDDEQPDQQVAKIYMIDSGQLDCNGGYDYFGCIQSSQMDWYLNSNDHSIPGIIYMHIPMPDLMTIYNKRTSPMVGEWTGDALNCFDEHNLQQTVHEANGDANSFMDYVLQNDDIFAMFHGHEHLIDAVLMHDNNKLLMGFGRKTGESWMIGVDIDFTMISGARVFEFDCNDPRRWTTWIRDKYLNVLHKTSAREIRAQKKSRNEHECDATSPVKCLSARHWQSWRNSVQQRFRHWLQPYLIDTIDVICRLQVPRFINDYIWDLGMEQKGQGIRSGFDT